MGGMTVFHNRKEQQEMEISTVHGLCIEDAGYSGSACLCFWIRLAISIDKLAQSGTICHHTFSILDDLQSVVESMVSKCSNNIPIRSIQIISLKGD